jgi:quinol monooxygenase YgiN
MIRSSYQPKKGEKNMIKVVARTLVREECIEAYHALAREIVEKTKQECGNVFYTMNQSMEDKRLHAMIEAWETMEALQAHMASEHFKRIVPQMAELAEEKYPPELYSEV